MSKDMINEAMDPINGNTTNFAAVNKIGDSFESGSRTAFTTPTAQKIDADTMFAEGSIGKIRFAGLAIILQEKGIIDLQQNAKEFFADEKVRKFLDKKYPGSSEVIGELFTGDSEKATLADLTTHYAGVGDLTKDHFKIFEKAGGITKPYKLNDLLNIPENDRVIPRDNGKPRAHNPNVEGENLPLAQYGEHQYSNLGYMLLGAAMEAAYFNKEGVEKTYQDLTNDFMLKSEFGSTKFPNQLKEGDNVVTANWVDGNGNMVDANQFTGANAAGGMFASANDSAKFFTEFFKGFPGTAEYGNERANKFFTKETIDLMKAEWEKHAPAGHDKGNPRYQGPGFVVTKDKSGNIIGYDKNGETLGYISNMVFDPKTNAVDISMIAQENISDFVAKKAGVKLEDLMSAYRDDKNLYDRATMYKDFKEDIEKVKAKIVMNGPEGKEAVITAKKGISSEAPTTNGPKDNAPSIGK